jgi:hypothetical protein
VKWGRELTSRWKPSNVSRSSLDLRPIRSWKSRATLEDGKERDSAQYRSLRSPKPACVGEGDPTPGGRAPPARGRGSIDLVPPASRKLASQAEDGSQAGWKLFRRGETRRGLTLPTASTSCRSPPELPPQLRPPRSTSTQVHSEQVGALVEQVEDGCRGTVSQGMRADTLDRVCALDARPGTRGWTDCRACQRRC